MSDAHSPASTTTGVVPAASLDDNTVLSSRRRERKPVDHTAKATAAIVRSTGRRIGAEHDPEDLPLLRLIEAALDDAWRLAVGGLRAQGRSDADIARVLGTSRQAVRQRWPHEGPQ